MTQPFSSWWPITVASVESAMSSRAHTSRPAITRSKNMYTPARTSVAPSNESPKSAVGVDPRRTTGVPWPAARKRSAACTTPSRSRRGTRELARHDAHGVEDVAEPAREEPLRFLEGRDGDGTRAARKRDAGDLVALRRLHMRPQVDAQRRQALAQALAIALDLPAVDDERGRFHGVQAHGRCATRVCRSRGRVGCPRRW